MSKICKECKGRGITPSESKDGWDDLCTTCNGEGEIIDPKERKRTLESRTQKYFWGERASRLAEIGDFDKDFLVETHAKEKRPFKKFGLDFHGVIDKHYEVLASWARAQVRAGNEVHIVTGSQDTPEFRKELKRCAFVEGKNFTHFFSITDFHVAAGNDVKFDEKGFPWMSKELWEPTKGYYALREGLDALWDDSPSYSKYMPDSCVYITFSPDKIEEQSNWLTHGRERRGR